MGKSTKIKSPMGQPENAVAKAELTTISESTAALTDLPMYCGS
jgi:hypothetical protein